MLRGELQGLGAIGRGEDLIPACLQIVRDEFAHGRFVVDDQDRLLDHCAYRVSRTCPDRSGAGLTGAWPLPGRAWIEPVLRCPGHYLHPGVQVKLGHDVIEVTTDGTRTDGQLRRDLSRR